MKCCVCYVQLKGKYRWTTCDLILPCPRSCHVVYAAPVLTVSCCPAAFISIFHSSVYCWLWLSAELERTFLHLQAHLPSNFCVYTRGCFVFCFFWSFCVCVCGGGQTEQVLVHLKKPTPTCYFGPPPPALNPFSDYIKCVWFSRKLDLCAFCSQYDAFYFLSICAWRSFFPPL